MCQLQTNPPIGFLFRAQPSLLTAEASSHIMDEIFNSDDEEARSRLLKIMQDFLISESEKHATKEKEKGVVYVIEFTPRCADSSRSCVEVENT